MSEPSEARVVLAAKARTRRVVEAIKQAMLAIGKEVKDNDGIYPHNHGRLTMAEVCRRAGVHQITMMGKAHRDTTRPMIVAWIEKLGMIRGALKVRRAVTKRSNTANAEYRRIATQFQAMYQLEMPRRDLEIAQLQAKSAELEAENERLRAQVYPGRVVQLPKTRHK